MISEIGKKEVGTKKIYYKNSMVSLSLSIRELGYDENHFCATGCLATGIPARIA